MNNPVNETNFTLHNKFPGFSLWRECLQNNISAWKEMKRYNTHDVLSTEELYLKLRAWTPQAMPKVYAEHTQRDCATCGKRGMMQSRGYNIAKEYKTQRLQCRACGSWQVGKRIRTVKGK